MKVGDYVWVFSENRRRYTDPKPGRLFGEIIYREHFAKCEIVSETLRSWVLRDGTKIPKSYENKTAHERATRVYFTEAEVDDDVFMNDHRYIISRCVQVERSPDVLKRIAELIGYTKHKETP